MAYPRKKERLVIAPSDERRLRSALHGRERSSGSGLRACSGILAALVLLAALAALVYRLPPIHDRLAWRVEGIQAAVQYALNPPEEVVFTPGQAGAAPPLAPAASLTPSPSATPAPTQPGPTATLTPSPTPTFTPTPLPSQARLTGILHQYQMWNNCGPANLAMALSFWGWKGDQRDTAAVLKPNPRDKNVMPYEMADYVEVNTELAAILRVGGELKTLEAFIAAGFPVIVEKGFEGQDFDGWMGHYEVVSAFDSAAQTFTVQDSYYGPDIQIPYEKLYGQWRAFNFTYIVPYPLEREGEVLSILGPQADLNYNYQFALARAQAETESASGRDLYFAWYNLGTNRVNLKDFAGAATAFDAAFANYPAIPEKERPWRMLWYQTGPYFAYYHSQRFQDVIDLASTTLQAMNEPNLEESYYWRGLAQAALGDVDAAIEDYRQSLEHHEGFTPALEQLQALGVEP